MEIKRLSGHVIICGFGRLGHDLANQLSHRGIPFIVIDIDPQKILEANEAGMLSIQGDATSEDVLADAQLPVPAPWPRPCPRTPKTYSSR